MKKILILASNPKGDLRLDREIRDLKKAIQRSKNSDKFAIETELAVLPKDLLDLLDDSQPQIVHFCGHGKGKDGIVLFSNKITWNYANFLDYASEHLLMKKVGGGYIFYHRMLMEHFANMELEQ